MTDTDRQTPAAPGDLVEAAGFPPGQGVVRREYDPRLTNADLAPL